jgi:hypothetical protein
MPIYVDRNMRTAMARCLLERLRSCARTDVIAAMAAG